MAGLVPAIHVGVRLKRVALGARFVSAALHPSARLRCMSKTAHVSETPATQWLRERGVAFGEHTYDYVERGGTAVSARELGVDEHRIVKTLVMEDSDARPLLILMHGDRQVSTKDLARQLGCKRIAPCDPVAAQRHTGYQVGGTSPFGTRKPLPVYVERSVLALERIYINGGRRGYLVSIEPSVLEQTLGAVPVECALEG
jgi:Cys-tRNA(Pro) deacylase